MSRTGVRALIVVCALGAASFAWLDWRRAHPPDVEVFHLRERALRLAAQSPESNSLVDWYVGGPGGSAHLHVFGKGTTCHLHLHDHTEEASIPVLGRPIVAQRFAVDGTLTMKRAQYDEGTMIVSPRYCAHEWVNASQTENHASLVLTLGDRFPGNTFIGPDDPRIAKGTAPSVFDAHADLASFVAGPDRVRVIDVPVTLGAIEEVLVKDAYVVEPKAGVVTLVYAVAGEGSVEGAGDRIALTPETLVLVRSSPRMNVVASPTAPLALFVVRLSKG
jgi:hypothetical protein